MLQSLAEIKSIVLLTDLPGADNLIKHLFISFYDIMSASDQASPGEKVANQVELYMTNLLEIMVDESPSLPTTVVDITMAQFLRVDPRILEEGRGKAKRKDALADNKQTTLLLREYPRSYNMAKNLCNACADKMARYVSQYFSEVIIDASGSATDGFSRDHRRSSPVDSDDEETSGPSEGDMQELRKAHRLLRELWRACPDVLQNVIPQLEAELSAENVNLRVLATETLGDLISGIGVCGPPPAPTMDPAAYPPMDLTTYSTPSSPNILTTPSAPKPFSMAHPSAWNGFLSRQQDKSAFVRSAWATCVGRIIQTSAGGVGLNESEEQRLTTSLRRMLGDGDERVRLAAVKILKAYDLSDLLAKFGSSGGISQSGSLLSVLAERVKDRKPLVREEAMKILARMWGVAEGEIEEDNDQVINALGDAPSQILNTYYTNEMDVHALLDRVIFEQLLPLNYPPIKSKATKAVNGNSQSQKGRDTQAAGAGADNVDPDQVRAKRFLILVKHLDERAKKVMFAIQGRQNIMSKVMKTYLERCEQYNGGVVEENEGTVKGHLTKLIDTLSKTLPDPARVSADLWKFAKMHDRRNYQLIKFCMAPESDYRTVHKAIKELTKRIEAAPSAPAGLIDTLMQLLYRSSLLIYNKSHIPAIMEFSKTDKNGLSAVAHEVLTDISSRNPEILKTQVQDMCRTLEESAPSAKVQNESDAVDTLKACAGFAKKYPAEIPGDRKFTQAMTNFALFGTPPQAAKYAVATIMASSDKKNIYARDILRKCTDDFNFDSDNALTRLAAIAQLSLLAPEEAGAVSDAIIEIAVEDILLKNRHPADPESNGYTWADAVDRECIAKEYALKILVNLVRSHQDPSTLEATASSVFRTLITLVKQEGELSTDNTTPATYKPRLRLRASFLLLKLCSSSKALENLLEPADFNSLALVVQDQTPQVRSTFATKLKKYLGQSKLTQRFYTPLFLLAYEPSASLKNSTMTWLRSRASHFSRQKSTVFEAIFSRLFSLLAHHPDYNSDAKDIFDMAAYFLYFLMSVATEDNLPLLFHVSQRIKAHADAIEPSKSENLYYLSDLAQAVIRHFEEEKGWTLQTWPGKMKLSASLFAMIESHAEAQKVADRDYLPEGVAERLDGLVRSTLKPKAHQASKKRKSEAGIDVDEDDNDTPAKKKTKKKTLTVRSKGTSKKRDRNVSVKTPNKKTGDSVPESERRKSGRAGAAKTKNYAEGDSEEDDEDMEMWDQAAEGDDGDKEGGEQSVGSGDEEELAEEADPEPEPAAESEPEAAPEPESEAGGGQDEEEEEEERGDSEALPDVSEISLKPTRKGKATTAAVRSASKFAPAPAAKATAKATAKAKPKPKAATTKASRSASAAKTKAPVRSTRSTRTRSAAVAANEGGSDLPDAPDSE